MYKIKKNYLKNKNVISTSVELLLKFFYFTH